MVVFRIIDVPVSKEGEMTILAINSNGTTRDTPGERRELPQSMVERMTLILDVFDSATSRLTLEQVARSTRLPRSTAHRILDQLVRLDWLAHSSAGYSLGTRALGLGRGNDGHMELREAAAGVIHDLQLRTGLVVHLGILQGASVRILDKVGGRFADAVPTRVGGFVPAHCSALGKSLLAWVPAEDVDALYQPMPQPRTERSVADLPTLHHELLRTRARKGLAFERGENHPDFGCVAAAIRDNRGAVGAVSLVGDAATPLERVAPLVVDAARRIGTEIFGEYSAGLPQPRPAMVG